MTQDLHDKIATVLTTYLNRVPSEAEIINGQNDPRVMQWVTNLPN